MLTISGLTVNIDLNTSPSYTLSIMISGCQRKVKKRKKVHGFLGRKRTKKGALVLKKRRRKGRKRLSV